MWAKEDAWPGAWYWSTHLVHLPGHRMSAGLALGWVSYEWLGGG